MRIARKTALWFGLIGSVSLFHLQALAQDGAPAADEAVTLQIEHQAAEPSFHDVATPVPVAAPAPVIDIPLPDPAPVAAALQTDALRIAVEGVLADESATRGLRLNARNIEALAAFYAQADKPLLWARDGAWTPAARAVAERLKAADEDGLDPAAYPLPDMGMRASATPAQWALADLKLSAAAIRYARDARGARLDPSRLSALATPTLAIPEVAEVLAGMSGAQDAGAALAAYNPPHPGYQALKERLAKLRANHPSRPSVKVPKGPTLRVGMKDTRVPLIRSRFNIKDDENETVYDARLASAVAAFQKQNGLPDSGVLTPQTVAALSGSSVARMQAEIIANMERWRWLPAELGTRHIFVNVPEYQLRLLDKGKVVHQTRVIVGKQNSQTPIFSQDMKYLVVNPSWTIPPSIMKKEILPALASDPTYAARKGYKVIRRGDRIVVQQPPGERNALGFVKFMFPNQHAVYLHDTPNRNLFSASKRAFSHGCVRVEQPFQLAEEVLGQDGKWSAQRLRGLIGKGERYVHLSNPLPVHLTYFTMSIDERGEMRTFEDLYGLDGKVRAALNLN